jgi:hypothetical protein
VGFALAVSWGCVAERPEGAPVSDASAGDIAAAMVDQGVVVCKLVGRDSIVEVRAAEGGTRYTLRDEAGTLVAANLDADALARIRPDLDPRSMQADEPVMGPLMLIDTDR